MMLLNETINSNIIKDILKNNNLPIIKNYSFGVGAIPNITKDLHIFTNNAINNDYTSNIKKYIILLYNGYLKLLNKETQQKYINGYSKLSNFTKIKEDLLKPKKLNSELSIEEQASIINDTNKIAKKLYISLKNILTTKDFFNDNLIDTIFGHDKINSITDSSFIKYTTKEFANNFSNLKNTENLLFYDKNNKLISFCINCRYYSLQ